MKKIHLHIEYLSLPGYSPAERCAFVAALERELAASGMTGNPSPPPLANSGSLRVHTPDLKPRIVAQHVVAGIIPGQKRGGRS